MNIVTASRRPLGASFNTNFEMDRTVRYLENKCYKNTRQRINAKLGVLNNIIIA